MDSEMSALSSCRCGYRLLQTCRRGGVCPNRGASRCRRVKVPWGDKRHWWHCTLTLPRCVRRCQQCLSRTGGAGLCGAEGRDTIMDIGRRPGRGGLRRRCHRCLGCVIVFTLHVWVCAVSHDRRRQLQPSAAVSQMRPPHEMGGRSVGCASSVHCRRRRRRSQGPTVGHGGA